MINTQEAQSCISKTTHLQIESLKTIKISSSGPRWWPPTKKPNLQLHNGTIPSEINPETAEQLAHTEKTRGKPTEQEGL